jgi:exodeoxyribonuclease VII large subunit
MESHRTVYTPSELNHEARLHLEAGFGRVWLEGEISNMSRPASGHLYFSIKDEKAQVRCAMFRSSANGISFRPENGQQVQAKGRLSIYEASGSYQLIVESMEAAGEGRLRAAFEALKKKLQTEGLFDPALKKDLPAYPTRIAVITSPSGAVIRDILNVLKRRWPLAAVRLYPVPVQGQEAAAAISSSLASVNAHGWAQAVIVGRGGGSLEDLQAFNDETVARAISISDIPVVSAVGHETDFSISDFVADLRAPTPSAAAELLTPDSVALRNTFSSHLNQLTNRMNGRLQMLAQKHDHLAHRLVRLHPERQLQEHRKSLSQLLGRLSHSGRNLIPERRARAEHLAERVNSLGSRLVADRQHRLQELARTLNAVSPLPTLDRGYAILASDDKTILDTVVGVKKGQAVIAQLADGRIHATVSSVDAVTLVKGKL